MTTLLNIPPSRAEYVQAPPPKPTLRLKRIHPDAILPAYQTDGAACFDLHAILGKDEVVRVAHGHPKDFRIGWAFEVPPGWVMEVHSRSGHGFKHSTRLANCTGIIDSDFRGEMRVKLCLDADVYCKPLEVRHGDRVGQARLVRAEQWHLLEVGELSETARGAGGFGSTGA